MRIAKAELAKIPCEPPVVLKTAAGVLTRSSSLQLRLTSDSGLVGVGEAAPLSGYSVETVADCAEALNPQGLLGRPVQPNAAAIKPPAARFAFETAVFDLLARAAGKPFAAMLSQSELPSRVPLSTLLTTRDEHEARAAVDRGVRALKLKLVHPAEDLEHVARLRAIFGDIEIRLDANGVAVDLAPFLAYGIAFVEEPRDRRACPLPYALDESLARPAIDLAGAVAVVLKPTRLGLVRAIEVARRATAAGIGVVVTHCFEGPIAHAAASALAIAWGTRACGLDRHAAIQHEALAHLRSDSVVLVDAPGLVTAAPDADDRPH